MKIKRQHKLKIIAFLLAVILWYFIVLAKPVEKILTVKIKTFPSIKNYLVYVIPDKVVVKLEGTRNKFRLMENRNFEIKINLIPYIPDTPSRSYKVRVPVEQIKLPSGIKIKEVNPIFITLFFKKIIKKRVHIYPDFIQRNLSKKELKKVKISPKYALIQGPYDLTSKIKFVKTEKVNFYMLKRLGNLTVNVLYPEFLLYAYPKKVSLFYPKPKILRKEVKKKK